ncbi:MAG: SPASM domain-containing protein, partial [Erysipelotrichaceae bacterium]|nr:SPASM domain-containing protein [Erysipelotrichaceae bacterium]
EEFLTRLDENNFQVQLVTNGALLVNYPHLTDHPCIRKLSISLHSLDYQQLSFEAYFKPILALIANPKCYIELRFWTGEKASRNTLEALKYLQTHYPFDTTSKLNSYQISDKVYVHFDQPFQWPSEASQDECVGTCLGARNMLGILADLTVVPCCLDAEGTINLGNLKTQSLQEILQSSRYTNMVKNLENRKLTEELCKKCSYRLRFNKP